VSERESLREQVRALTQQLADEEDEVGLKQAALNGAYEQVRALTADNAALLGAVRSALQRMLAQDWSAARETLLEAAEKPHPGAAMLAEMESIKSTLDAAGVPSTPGECEVDERPLTLGERVALLVRSRDNRSTEADSLRARVAELEADLTREAAAGTKAERERDAAQQRSKALRDAVGNIVFAIRRGLSRKEWDGALTATRPEWQQIDDAFTTPEEG